MVLVLCLYFLLASSVSGMFRCPKAGKTFTEDGCATCHICHQDRTPTSLPPCENGTLCDLTKGHCIFKDEVTCPSAMKVGWHKTIVLIEKQTTSDQYMFVRGGISHDLRQVCKTQERDARESDCALDIRIHELGKGKSEYSQYNAYRTGDMKLDFYGAEYNQATYHGRKAEGTAMVWSTNNQTNTMYNKYNRKGDDYWLINMEMDCEHTEQGWFELKAYLRDGEGWETDITAEQDCGGNIGGSAPFKSTNHVARCGFVNIFRYGDAECEINTVSSYETEG